MSPHGKVAASTGAPRCVFHMTEPVNTSSEYTVLFSVATITWPATIKGDAYTSPSTPTFHATDGDANAGISGPWPARPASRWYSAHSVAIAGEGEEVAAPEGAGEARGALQAAQTSASRAARTRREATGPS